MEGNAAHNREVREVVVSKIETTTKENLAVGNAAKIREALTEARKVIKAMGGYWARETLPIIDAALAAPPRVCDVMSLESARKLWFAKEILPRLNGDLPLGKEVPFEEWFVSKLEQETKGKKS